MSLREKIVIGLWHDNPGLVQLLGLCPLLAVTTTFKNGLGLGIATLLVVTFSNMLVSATRRWLSSEIRIPIYVLIIASLVTCVELLLKAYFPGLDRSLGIFVPLIVTNCTIVARAELFASRNNVRDSSAAKPSPITRPSTMLSRTLFRDANSSARATMVQLVTISGTKIPSERSRSGK